MECEQTILKENLKENSEHFEQWRYYYELGANTVNIPFMDKLLQVTTTLLEVLKNKKKNY